MRGPLRQPGPARRRPAEVEAALRTVRSLLHGLGYRFRLGRTDLPGSPDLVLPRWRLAVFVVDCARYPHPDCRRRWAGGPGELTAEAERLDDASARLARLGYETLVLQACDAEAPEALRDRLDIALQGRLIAAPGRRGSTVG